MNKEKTTILIIEANQFILGLYTAKFSINNKFKIYTAKTLEQALAIYLKTKIKVIIIGTSLIKKHNKNILSEFSQKAAKDAVPLIVAGNIDLPSEFRFLKGGMFSFVDMMRDNIQELEAEVKRAIEFHCTLTKISVRPELPDFSKKTA